MFVFAYTLSLSEILSPFKSTNGESGVTESNIRIIQAPASTGGTTMSTNSSQGPMRLVRVLNSTAPSGTSAIRPIAPTTSTGTFWTFLSYLFKNE